MGAIRARAWQTARGSATAPGLVEVLRVAGGSETRVYAVAHDGMWQADGVPLVADTPNALTARLQNAAGVWSAWSAPVVVTVMVVPPLYSVGLRPAVVNLSATLHATATARGLSETVPGGGGAVWPVVRSVSAYPLGASAATQTVSLTRTQAAASLTVWETWRPAGVWDCALSQCEYEIRFEGVDAEGYVGWGHTAFRLDKSKPTAPRIRQPASNDADGLLIHWTRQPKLTVAGVAGESGLTGGSAPVTATAGGVDNGWSAPVVLLDGPRALVARAYDEAGNESERDSLGRDAQIVWRDTTPPVIVAPEIYVRLDAALTLTITVTDDGQAQADSVAVTVTHPRFGGRYALTRVAGDQWQAGIAPFGLGGPDGTYAARYTAGDKAGNTADSGPRALVVDGTAPGVSIVDFGAGILDAPWVYGALSPTPTVYYGAGSAGFTVTVAVTDDRAGLGAVVWPALTSAGATMALAGELSATRALRYTFGPASAQAGVFSVTARDRAGNVAGTSLRLARDVTPPEVVLSAYSRSTNGVSELRIAGVDAGAGVRGYDVDMVEDGLTRTVIARNTLVTTHAQAGLRAGHVYAWVVTATDNVNNAQTYTATVAAARAVKTYYPSAALRASFGTTRVAVRRSSQSSVASSQMMWLHNDHLSSVSAGTDAQGGVVGRQWFAPYGEARAEAGEVAGALCYST